MQRHRRAAELLGEERTQQVVFLIDEIECHLHPRWQRTILSSLIKMIKVIHKSADIQLIASTHSPLVMVSAEPLFDSEQDTWFDMDLDQKTGQVEIKNRPFVRLGGASNWLMSEAFDLPTDRSTEGEMAIKNARACYADAKVKRGTIVKVEQELFSSLGSEDRFWKAWDRFLEKKGVAPLHGTVETNGVAP